MRKRPTVTFSRFSIDGAHRYQAFVGGLPITRDDVSARVAWNAAVREAREFGVPLQVWNGVSQTIRELQTR